jgi:hypothetical protein
LGYRDRIKQIEDLYIKTGAMGSETHKEATERANELYRLELDGLLEKGQISKAQYNESLEKATALSDEAKAQAEFEKEKADTLKAQEEAVASMTQGAQAMAESFQTMTKEMKELVALLGTVSSGEGVEAQLLQGTSGTMNKIATAAQSGNVNAVKTVRIELPTASGSKSVNVMPGEEDVFTDWLTSVLKGRSTA